MRESVIEKHFVKRIRALGGEVRKVKFLDRKGAPDRLVMFQNGLSIWVELKATDGTLEPAQVREHVRLVKMGQVVMTLNSIEAVDLAFPIL